MSKNFDYDITHYSVKDLEDMIGVCYPYNSSHIDEKTTQLVSMLKNTSSPQDIPKLEKFVSLIKLQLNNELKPSSSNTIYNVNNENFLIKKPDEFIMHAVQDKYSPGTVNPLSQRTVPKSITIDTRFRKNYFNTDPANLHVTLPFRVTKAISMHLDSAQIPASYYPINSAHDNNNFIIAIISNNLVFNLQVVIPDGYYTITEFMTYLNSVVFSTDYDEQILTQGMGTIAGRITGSNGKFVNRILAKYHPVTGKIIISIVPNYGATHDITQIILDFARPIGSMLNNDLTTWVGQPINSIQLRLGWMLGYRVAQYTGNTTYAAEAVMDIAGTNYIYVVVDDYQNNSFDFMMTAFADSYMSKNILARIPVQGSLGTRVPFTTISMPHKFGLGSKRVYFGPVDIEKINISLLDDLGRKLNLNNRDWNFTINFEAIYE